MNVTHFNELSQQEKLDTLIALCHDHTDEHEVFDEIADMLSLDDNYDDYTLVTLFQSMQALLDPEREKQHKQHVEKIRHMIEVLQPHDDEDEDSDDYAMDNDEE